MSLHCSNATKKLKHPASDNLDVSVMEGEEGEELEEEGQETQNQSSAPSLSTFKPISIETTISVER